MSFSTTWVVNSYYWEAPTRFFDTERAILIHIGLAIPNALFKLVIYPQLDINGLEQWEELFSVEGSIIWCNGQAIRHDTMIKIINTPASFPTLKSAFFDMQNTHLKRKDNFNRLPIKDNFCIRHEKNYDVLLNIPTKLLKYV